MIPLHQRPPPTPATPSSGGLGARGRRSGLKARSTQLLALRFGWLVIVIWYEVGEFFSSLSSCKFPDSVLRDPVKRYLHGTTVHAPTHLVLVADPHVPHPVLSHSDTSHKWVNYLAQKMEELFMRKSWNVVMRLGRVDGVIVLGDMLDWGRGTMSDEDYESYVQLFRSIFSPQAGVPMYYVPGNHDVPLGRNKLFATNARDRYEKYFQPFNGVLEVANHSLILLDSVGLVEEDYRRYADEMQFGEWDGTQGGVVAFVKSVASYVSGRPTILFSHIPLARPEAASCGPFRERGRISKGAGPGYQNLLGSDTSRFLLDTLQPSIVFSGDDHDYCDVVHRGGVREVTLKSFSASGGIRRPGFQLLSLVPPNPSSPYGTQRTIADRPCFLPDQAGVYFYIYLPLAILTVCYLFGTRLHAAYTRWRVFNPSLHGEKARPSPGLSSSEFGQLPTTRRPSDRPLQLTLPSRTSTTQLQSLTAMTPSASASGTLYPGRLTRVNSGSFDSRASSRSAPVSPSASPMPRAVYTDDKDDDIESLIDTPNLSRRSSYIYMNGGETHGSGMSSSIAPPSTNGSASYSVESTPSGQFLPLPGAADGRGLGLATPNAAGSSFNLRNTSSTNLALSPIPGSPAVGRKVGLPRVLSASDWSSAAKAKEKSVFGVMMDSLPVPGSARRPGRNGFATGVESARSFVRWIWKARNSVVGKSWRETLAVAWPPALAWLFLNALFFMG